MSGNGRGAQRPQGTFLVIGLLLALAILGFNYWNLSSANSNLEATNIDLQDQIRILTSKRLTEEQTKKELDRKYTLLEQRISLKDSEIKTLQSDVEAKKSDQEQAETAKKECETNLHTCETNNHGIQEQLGEVNKQLDELKKKEDQQPNCDSQCQGEKKKLLTEMYQKAGAAVMQQLINAGVDVGEDIKVQVQQSVNVKQMQPPEQNQKVEAQKAQQQSQNSGQPQDVNPQVPNPADSQKEPKNAEEHQEGQGKTNTNSTDGLLGSLKDKLKYGVESLSQKIPLHDIINQTQEGIKQGFKKSQDLVGHLTGGAGENMHESANSTIENDFKNDTLVGTKVEEKPAVNDTKKQDEQKANDVKQENTKENLKENGGEVSNQIKPPHEQGETKKGDQNKKDVKDDAYEDDDEDKELDKVEGDKELRFKPKKPKGEEDSIDALRRRLDNN